MTMSFEMLQAKLAELQELCCEYRIAYKELSTQVRALEEEMQHVIAERCQLVEEL